MKYPNKDYIEHLRRKYPPGTRLQLSCMEDEFPVPPGSMGTVECIDDAGQIHVDWDCGRSLALIPGVDSFSRLPSPKEKAGDARLITALNPQTRSSATRWRVQSLPCASPAPLRKTSLFLRKPCCMTAKRPTAKPILSAF